jgi:hypothetical protein
MDPMTMALVMAAIGAGTSALGGVAGRQTGKQSQTQKMQSSQIDQILAGIQGQGPYADLFQADEAAFQKSYVDPAMSRFKNQITPGIQQSYIASGQQRGTGLEDTLTRAGVDMNSLLNEAYGQFQGQAQNRQMSGLNAALGYSGGAPAAQGAWQAAGQGLAGYGASQGGQQSLSSILDLLRGGQQQQQGQVSSQDFFRDPRTGYSR